MVAQMLLAGAAVLLAPLGAGAGIDPTLPDISPSWEQNSFQVTQRLGGNTLEFGIFTANVGGRDWRRPLRPGIEVCRTTGDFRIRYLYQYTLYNQIGTDPSGDPIYEYVSEQLKPTICTIDNGTGAGIACLQEHGRVFTCSCNQGISRGWSDSYYRTLSGQWVFIGSATGSFLLVGELDPDLELQAADIPDDSKDATHDNNVGYVYFDWDGASLSNMTFIDGYNATDYCPG